MLPKTQIMTVMALVATVTLASGRKGPSIFAAEAQRTATRPPTSPNCAGVNQWPTSMAFAYLKNANLTNNDRVDFTKTKTTRIASEQIGNGLFRQVHRVVFREKSGSEIETITVNDASNEECSASGVDVFVISRHLGPN